MDGSEALSTIAELALGLAGFTGIVAVFGRRPGRLRPVEAYRLVILLSISCGAMFLALLPFALHRTGLEGETLWAVASGALAAYTVLFLGWMFSPTRRFLRDSPEIFDKGLLMFLILAHLVNFTVQLLNAFGVFGRPSLGIYLFGLMWLLLHGFQQFARILFIRPDTR